MENIRITVIADLGLIELNTTKDELEKVQNYHPEILVKKDEKDNELFRISGNGNSLSKAGASASKESNSGRLVIEVPFEGTDLEDKFGRFTKAYKNALEDLDEMVGQIKLASRGIDSEINALAHHINIVDAPRKVVPEGTDAE
jgi:hypothetical protein